MENSSIDEKRRKELAMARSIRIPNDLWFIVGRALSSMGYIDKDSPILDKKETPTVRAILLEKEEWQSYCSQLKLINPNYMRDAEEELETACSFTLFIAETLKRKDLLEQFPEIVPWHVEKRFVGFENAILINADETEETFKQVDEVHLYRFGKPFYFTVDSCRLAFLILEFMHIYESKLGKSFTENDLDESILQNKIFLLYLKAYSLHPKDFKLDFFGKSDQQESIEKQIHQNILKALKQKQPSFLTDDDGNKIAEFNVGKLFSIKEGKLQVDFGQIGLKVKGNYVGLGHILYAPWLFGARNVQEVLDSWNWFLKETKVSEETLQIALEACSLLRLLLTGRDEGENVHFFSLLVNLHELDLAGIYTRPKTEEFGHKIRSYMRKFEKRIDREPWRAILGMENLRTELSNLSSECMLARVAEFFGYSVKLGKHPDLTINNKKIEVKRLSSYDKYADLSNPINEGLIQNPYIIAIQVNSFEKRSIKGYKAKWLGRGNLNTALKTALAFGKSGNCVLLFSGTKQGLKGRIVLLK
jgi:hypothetical protein